MFNNLGLALRMALKLGKKVKTKLRRILGANFYVCGSYRGNMLGGIFAMFLWVLDMLKQSWKIMLIKFYVNSNV